MNMNIFGMFFLTRIRIQIYSGITSGPNTNIFVSIKGTKYEYSNIFGLNIQILFYEYWNIPWNAAIAIKFCIPKIPRSQLKFAQSSPHGNILRSSYIQISATLCLICPDLTCPLDTLQTHLRNPPHTFHTTIRHQRDKFQSPSRHPQDIHQISDIKGSFLLI